MRTFIAVICALLLAGGEMIVCASEAPQAATPAQQESTTLPNEQLDSLVAPIALYPDPLLAQTLVASTYPLEIIQLQQWLAKNPRLKDKALTDAVQKQDWDPSVQAMATFSDLVRELADNIKWTTDLGNAFLAQQKDVMDAVQRMRVKAKNKGNLKSTEQQTVETKVVESQPVIVIEQASPEVVYVPSYDPMMMYGAAPYPYPPMAYPPGYVAGRALAFGAGVAIGAAWGGGGWGYNSGWGGNNNVYVNHNNTFVNNSNRQNFNNQNINRGSNQGPRGGNNSWQHNPQHRGGAPYSNGATAKKFGGTTRGDSMSNRQASARQNTAGAGSRPQAGTMDRGGSSGFGGGGGGGDRVGNRSVSPSSNSRNSSAFGSGGMNGSSARASSSRGSSSMSGGSRASGGGSRGGGSRGGGGGRRR
jgi:hypothetical protein